MSINSILHAKTAPTASQDHWTSSQGWSLYSLGTKWAVNDISVVNVDSTVRPSITPKPVPGWAWSWRQRQLH